MKTPELGDILFKRKEDKNPLGFIIRTEDYIELYNFKTQKRETVFEGSILNGILLNREQVERIFRLDEILSIILDLVDKIIFIEGQNRRLKKENETILDQANEYWANHKGNNY